ncbi:MAG: repressor LexA, partial [Magnetococcales bacterium]|nr:repressor LexA [Magnetococcales bacterium]
AVENIIGEISVSSSDVRGNCFALEVVGDSMIDANINEGDYLIVRQQPVAENGDIVVALLDDEATVKRFFMFDDHIELRPANPKYKPIRVGPQNVVYIIGKVVAVTAKASTNIF